MRTSASTVKSTLTLQVATTLYSVNAAWICGVLLLPLTAVHRALNRQFSVSFKPLDLTNIAFMSYQLSANM